MVRRYRYEQELYAGLSYMAFGVIAFFGVIIGLIAAYFPDTFANQLMVFMLSAVVGYNAIWSVAPALHTPLMSVSNAISGIVILGGMLQVTGSTVSATFIFGAFAVGVAAVNIGGGFYVTYRMLQMFVLK